MGTLMMRPVTVIKFTANPDSGRDIAFTANFCKEVELSDTWVDMTNQAKVTFPKNIYVLDRQNNRLPLGGNNPSKLVDTLFRRGDKISVNLGAYTYDEVGREVYDVPAAPIFQGYISKVSSKIPITLECEDNMWLLKQIPCKPQVWPKDKTVEDLLKSLLTGTGFTVNALTSTTIGNFLITNETVAQLLTRLRKEYHLESYFRGNELRIGGKVYIDSEAKTNTFEFQKNIISDQLIFQRKDDVILSAVVNSVNTIDAGTNKKGQAKTKQDRLSVLVYVDPSGNFKYEVKKEGVDFPANFEGERRTLFFPNVKSAAELAQKGIDELKKYYYTGFKGSFTTFIIPYVKQGDNVLIKDRIMPDRDGKYKVRSVKYTGGVAGHQQIITLDYKIG